MVVFNASDYVLERCSFHRMMVQKVSLQLSNGVNARTKARLVPSGALLRRLTGISTLGTFRYHRVRDRLVVDSKKDTIETAREKTVGG